MSAPGQPPDPLTGHGSDVLAFDIGGANLKAADERGRVWAEGFELWRRADELGPRLAALAAGRPRRIVATMTGEIADCYPDRAAGVAGIVTALLHAARSIDAELGIYRLDGRIVSAEEALSAPLSVAASNWHALARLAAARADSDRALLVDVGSTTTDIVLLDRRGPRSLATDDAGRMASGELVYTGIERTPVAAIVRSLPLAGRRRAVAAETFARSQDAWLLLGGLPEDPASHDTADGGPATRDAARTRLARMTLLEPAEVGQDDAVAAAVHVADRQARLVAAAIRRVLASHGIQPDRVVLSGHGGALASMALARAGLDLPRLRLEEAIGPAAARAAPAVALALVATGGIP